MLTKTKTALLAAALTFGTIAVASADGYDPNLGNRYPAYNEPGAVQPFQSGAPQAQRNFWSAPSALRQGRAVRPAPSRY